MWKHEKKQIEKKPGLLLQRRFQMYLVRNSQDRKLLGVIFLTNNQLESLSDILKEKGIIFTRD